MNPLRKSYIERWCEVMQEMLKRINCDRNNTLDNQGTCLDSAHLRFGSVGTAI